MEITSVLATKWTNLRYAVLICLMFFRVTTETNYLLFYFLFWDKLTTADNIRFSFPKSGCFLLLFFFLHYWSVRMTQNCARYFLRAGSIIRDVISYPFLYSISLQYRSTKHCPRFCLSCLDALLTLRHE